MIFYDGQEILFANYGSGQSYDIVVPGTSGSDIGTPGLIAMYNKSSGLRLDGYDRICIAAATEEEIDVINTAGAIPSVNKPIVPHTLKYAVRAASFKGDISEITNISDDAKTPASALSVLNFVLNRENAYDTLIKQYINDSNPVVKRAKIPKDGTFEIKPGTIAIIFPWDKAIFRTPGDYEILTGSTSIVFATHRYNPTANEVQDDVMSETGTHYEVSIITLSGFSPQSSHSNYEIRKVNNKDKFCYFVNNAGTVDLGQTGLAYVTYIQF